MDTWRKPMASVDTARNLDEPVDAAGGLRHRQSVSGERGGTATQRAHGVLWTGRRTAR
jgi:hypothetical protein